MKFWPFTASGEVVVAHSIDNTPEGEPAFFTLDTVVANDGRDIVPQNTLDPNELQYRSYDAGNEADAEAFEAHVISPLIDSIKVILYNQTGERDVPDADPRVLMAVLTATDMTIQLAQEHLLTQIPGVLRGRDFYDSARV